MHSQQCPTDAPPADASAAPSGCVEGPAAPAPTVVHTYGKCWPCCRFDTVASAVTSALGRRARKRQLKKGLTVATAMATDPTLSADEVAAYVNWLVTAELGKGKELPLPPPHLSTSYRSKSLHRSKAHSSPAAFQPEMLDLGSGDEASRAFEEVDGEGDVGSGVVAEFCTVVRGLGMAGATDDELEDGEVFDLAPDNAAHWQRDRSISPPQPKPPREATTLELGATATTCSSTGSPRWHMQAELLQRLGLGVPTDIGPHEFGVILTLEDGDGDDDMLVFDGDAACGDHTMLNTYDDELELHAACKAGEKASAEVLLKDRTRCPTSWHRPGSNAPWASRTGGGRSRHGGAEMVAESESAAAPRLRSHKPLRRASSSMAKRADRFSGFDWADAHEEVVLVEVIDAGNRTEFC